MKTGHGAWFVRVWAAGCVATSAGAQGPFPVIQLDGASPAIQSAVIADGQAISLNFQNIDIRALLQVFAEFTGLNLVVSDAVSGQVSVRLRDVPWVQALGVVLESKGLTSRREGNVMWVAPKDEWTLREKKHLESQTALESVSPLQMLSLRLKYARATEVVQRLSGASGTSGAGASTARWLSARGTALAEPRTNQLFILDVPGRLAEVGQMIERLDVPVRQVLIEAQIVEADDQFGQSLGVRWGLGSAGRMGDKSLNLGATNATTGAGVVTGNQVNLPAGNAGQTLNVPSSLAVSLFNAAADRFINLEISALEADGRGKVVSRPRVITADQTKALIEQGTELPYQMSAGVGVTSITFRKANLKLEVTPQITPEGAVVLDVDVNRDSVGQLTPAGYAINTKHVKTQVQVDDGGTVVLGGIYEDADRNDEAKVPGLAEVPGLGWLFKNRNQTRRKSELLIFLTPRVVVDGGKLSAP